MELDLGDFCINVDLDFNLGVFDQFMGSQPEEVNFSVGIGVDLKDGYLDVTGRLGLDDKGLFNNPVLPPEVNGIEFMVEINFDLDLKFGKSFLKAKQEDVDLVITVNSELSDGNVDVVVNLDFEGGDLLDSPFLPVEELAIKIFLPVFSGDLDFKSD